MTQPSIPRWGSGWSPLADDNPLDAELHRELGKQHALFAAAPRVVGRCTTCDDVVAALAPEAGEPALAVIHLTWSGAAEKHAAFPYSERLGVDEFLARFIDGGEHL